MASLDEFNPTPTNSIDDFKVGLPVTAPVSNRPSNINIAAHAAAMTNDPNAVVKTFERSNAEMDMTGKSQTATDLVNVARDTAMGANKAALVSYLADPKVSDLDKQKAASGVLDKENSIYSTSNVLSNLAIQAPAGPSEPVETELARVSMADAINEVNSYKRDKQALLNREAAKSDTGTMAAFAGLVQTLVPGIAEGETASIVSQLTGNTASAYASSFTLMGGQKAGIREAIGQLPPEKRMEMVKQVVDIVNAHPGIAIPGTEDFARLDSLRTYLEDGYHNDFSEVADNVISVLDLTVLGGVIGRGVRGVGSVAEKALTGGRYDRIAASNFERDAVRTRVQPTTVSQNYKDTNPALATAAHEASAADSTGQAAEALYGTSRADAVGSDILPQVAKVDGSVEAKVGRPESINDAAITPSADVMDFVNHNGAIHYFEAEKRAMRARTVNNFEQARGMNARKEMFQVDSLPDGVGIKAVYGPAQGGFGTAEEAMEMAKWSLRETGIDDSAITILQRQGSEYVPVAKDQVKTDQIILDRRVELQGQEPSLVTSSAGTQTDIGSRVTVKRKAPDFLVQVDHQYRFSPGDVAEWAEADVKYNIFDRMDALNGVADAGSLQRHLLDAHSMLHPNITLGANVVVDKAAGLERELVEIGARNFGDVFKTLPRERQSLLDKMIKEANEQGLEFNYNKMVADGLNGEEIKALRGWKEYWDTMYHLENKDLVKSLRAQNYHEFVDETAGGTRLFAKPLARTQVSGDIKVYDHSLDQIRTMRADEVAELYTKDGVVARLRQPVRVGDDAAEMIVSVNAPGKNYLRALTDNTQVLNYRKGYYSVQYKDPHFIVKVEKNSRGEVLYERAVATAGSARDADLMVRRMTATDGKDYYRRGDTKKVDMASNNYWDLQQASGRSAQKIRGKRLEDATNNVMDPAMSNILSPTESMIAAARSVSRRVAMRDFNEAAKSRFMSQFEEFLPTGKYGQKVFPNNIKEIAHRGGKTPSQKDLADARTTFEYIRYLENGYINHIDESYKAGFKMLAEIAGNAGLSKAEKLSAWVADSKGPSALGKNIAFNMYLATNPLRQFVIQGHQAIQLTANFPRWVMGGRAVPEVSILTSFQMGYKPSKMLLDGAGLTMEGAEEMYKAFRRTGQIAAIDKQNLIRGSLTDFADSQAAGTITRYATAPLNFMRKVGFDAGENVNTMTSWLAHRDQAIRAGEDFSKADVQDRVAGMARNYTYNMNAAGDLPYNQNSLSILFQFQQAPHKALTGMLTNRVLSTAQKSRLLGFNALMYGLPGAFLYTHFGDILPEDQASRDVLMEGLEGTMLNKLIELSTGEKSRIDFDGLSPINMYGTTDFIHSLFTTDVGTIVAASPSGSLFFGNNPRLTNFAKSSARYFNLIDDYQDPTTFGRVANDFASMSSGYSNAFKAAYALKAGQKISSAGGVTDSSVTRPEAIAATFGFGTMDEAQRRYVNDTTYKKSKAFEDDVKRTYKDLKQHITKEGITPQEQEYFTKVFSEAWRVYGNDDYKARQIIMQELKKDAAAGDGRMYQSVMNMNGMIGTDQVKGLIKAMPGYDPAKQKAMLDTIDFMDSYKEEVK